MNCAQAAGCSHFPFRNAITRDVGSGNGNNEESNSQTFSKISPKGKIKDRDSPEINIRKYRLPYIETAWRTCIANNG